MKNIFFWAFVAVTILLLIAIWHLYIAEKWLAFYYSIYIEQTKKLSEALVKTSLRDGETIARQGRAIKLYCNHFEDLKNEYQKSKNPKSDCD